MSEYPLVSGRALDDILAWRPEGAVTGRDFLSDAPALRACLAGGCGPRRPGCRPAPGR